MSKMGQLFCDFLCDCDKTSENNDVTVKVYRKNSDVILPEYAKLGDACMDVYAHQIEFDHEKQRVIVYTGLYFAIPYGYEMEIRPRSSLTKYRWILANSPGTIDCGYRGEILVIFTPLDKDVNMEELFPFTERDRVCQIIVRKRPYIHWDVCDSYDKLGPTDRGSGGFGSTGK